jgi:hypothetical protein
MPPSTVPLAFLTVPLTWHVEAAGCQPEASEAAAEGVAEGVSDGFSDGVGEGASLGAGTTVGDVSGDGVDEAAVGDEDHSTGVEGAAVGVAG